MVAIAVRALTKIFDGVPAVDGVDLDVAPGEMLVVLGPSGSGKSTLLRLIAGFEPPTSGEVLIGGVRVTDLPARERSIAMVFQSYALYPHLTVAQNIGFRCAPPVTNPGRWPPGSPRRPATWASSTCSIASRSISPAASGSGWRWPGR